TLFPIVSSANAVPGVDVLEVQLAARYDKYTTHGADSVVATNASGVPLGPVTRRTNELHSLDPTIGLRYGPMPGEIFRASYGTGFLPPGLSQLISSPPSVLTSDFGFTDPQRGGEPVGDVDFVSGGNPNLRPEDSSSVSAGIIIEPRLIPNLRLSADWT